MDSVEFRFVTDNSLASRGIRLWTWPSEFSHVDLVMPGFAGYGLLGAMPGGVKLRPRLYDNPTKILYATVEVNDAAKVYAAAKSQIGKPYDFGAIAGLMFHRDWKDTGQWFCSELATWILLQDNTHILNPAVVYNLVTPGMMLTSIAMKYSTEDKTIVE